MNNINNDKEMKKIVKSLYEPVTPSPELKKRLFARLSEEASGESNRARLMLARSRVLIPVGAVIIAAVIGYGVWLSLTHTLT